MRNYSDSTPADEETLVGLAKTGSKDAFEALVKVRQSWLRNFLRRLTNDPALADDLSQQVLLSAWKGVRNLNSNRAFHSWLRRIAVNTWLNHARINEIRTTELASDEDIDQLIPANTESIAERIDLDRALAALGADVRLCVVLSYNDGMSHGMISEITKFPLGTVKSHIRKGTLILRKILAIYEKEA